MTPDRARIALAGARNAARLASALESATLRRDSERLAEAALPEAADPSSAKPIATASAPIPALEQVKTASSFNLARPPAPSLPPTGRAWLGFLLAALLRPLTRRLYPRVRYFLDNSAAAQSAARAEAAAARIELSLAQLARNLLSQQAQTRDVQVKDMREIVTALAEIAALAAPLARIDRALQSNWARDEDCQSRLLATMGEFGALQAGHGADLQAVREGSLLAAQSVAAMSATAAALQVQLEGEAEVVIKDLDRKLDQSQPGEARRRAADRQVAKAVLDSSTRAANHLEGLDRSLKVNFAYLSSIQSRIDLLAVRQSIPVDGGRRLALRNPEGYLIVPSDDVAQVVFLGQGVLPEPGSRAIMRHLLPPGGTMVDVGANLGLFTLIASRIVGRGGRVIAFEPAPEKAACLRQTVIINGLADRVELHEAAAGSVAGTARLDLGATSGWTSLLPLGDETRTVKVEVRTVDDIVGERSVDLVKIDVEGCEAQVVQGMSKLIARCTDMCIIVGYGREHLNRSGLTAEAWLSLFGNQGLNLFAIDENAGKIVAFDAERMDAMNILVGRNLAERFSELR